MAFQLAHLLAVPELLDLQLQIIQLLPSFLLQELQVRQQQELRLELGQQALLR